MNANPHRYHLHISAGEQKGKDCPLDKPVFLVGRGEDCDLLLENDPLISRNHAKFSWDPGGFWTVENLGSLNGVYVNKEKIETKQPLNEKDEIIIGNHLLVFKTNASLATPCAVQAPASPAGNSIMDNPRQKTKADSVRRLHILYQLIKASNSTNSPEALTRLILNFIFQDLRVDRGCIYLINPQTQEIKPVLFKVRGLKDSQEIFHPHSDILNLAYSEKIPIVQENIQTPDRRLSAAIVLPMLEDQQLHGLIYLDSSHPDFSISKEDLDFLETFSRQSSVAISKATLAQQWHESNELINRLEKHVGSAVTKIVRERKVELGKSDLETQEKEVAILFSDIVGFTSLSEKLKPTEIAFLLNGYFNHMADCVAKYNGYLNKYIGDAVMAVFGAPHSTDNDSKNAILCAQEMLSRLKDYWKTIDEKKRFQIRIGINTGVVTTGNIGSLSRMEYTVLGDPVNLASRLESNAKPGTILIGETTYRKVLNLFPFHHLGSITVKGKEAPVQIYQFKNK